MKNACFAPMTSRGEALKLAMQRLWVSGQVLPAGARLIVRHVFRSDESEPLEVIYPFPLPRDAALRRFRIETEHAQTDSELRPREDAAREYERGIQAGSLSALVQQYGDGLVNLSVGNIRPGETVVVSLEVLAGMEARDDGFRFRFPFTLAPGYHARARCVATGDGEGEIELPRDEFGDLILPRFRASASGLHECGFDLSVTGAVDIAELGSPSHAVRVRREGASGATVSLAPEKDVPNRDLVIDARYRVVQPQVLAGRGQFAAVIPSASFGTNPDTPRRVVFLIDRSGSMGGAPMQQALRSVEACLGALSPDDQFGAIAFDNDVELFRPELAAGSRDNRDAVSDFLRSIDARGGTELARGIAAAAQVLGGGGGDVLVLTDGQVFGTEAIIAQAKVTGTRLHCLGIGSASQDRFLAQLARETGGVSRFVGANERVDLAAVDLFASAGRPVASGLKCASNVSPEPPRFVFAGTPVLLFGDGGATVDVTWDGGSLSVPVPSGDDATGETVRLLRGARLIANWEARYPASEAVASADKRQQSRVAARLRALSEEYGLASREMSLVAVLKREGDREGVLPKTVVTPVGMPLDVSIEAYFNQPLGEAAPATVLFDACATAAPSGPLPSSVMSALSARAPRPRRRIMAGREDPQAQLMEIAARLEGDGGFEGDSPAARAAASIAALFAFVAAGHTANHGAFRQHVARLIRFLRSVAGLSPEQQRFVEVAIEMADHDHAPNAGWAELALRSPSHTAWREIEKALGQAARH